MKLLANLEGWLFRTLDKRFRSRATVEELHLAAIEKELQELHDDARAVVSRVYDLERAVRVDGLERWVLMERYRSPNGGTP